MLGHFAIRVSLCLAVTLLLAEAGVQAGRLRGTTTFNFERIDRQQDGEGKDNLSRETLLLSYEDALFVKNRLRLTADLLRREFIHSDFHEFRPSYRVALENYQYNIDVLYSPYTQRVSTVGGVSQFDVNHRDWRATARFNYQDLPSLSFVFTRQEGIDADKQRLQDAYNRNLVAETAYRWKSISARVNHSNLRQVNRLSQITATTRTYSTTNDLSHTFPGRGFVNTSYNYYDTRRESGLNFTQKSHTHSISSLASYSPITSATLNANYSGRFTRSSQGGLALNDRNHNLALRGDYSLTREVSLSATKGFQSSGRSGDNDVVEYVALSANASHYLRSGMDTRLNITRTAYQQSLRLRPILDSAGNTVGTTNSGAYTLDALTTTLAMAPRPYIDLYLHMSVTHDSDPVDENRRYQLARSLDSRFKFTRHLEGRVNITTNSRGAALEWNRFFSQQYNLGLSWLPSGSLNINATYIYSRFSNELGSRRSSFTGYVSYSFRRAFTTYVSLNDRKDTQGQFQLDTGEVTDITLRPQTINAQIVIYVSGGVTATAGYFRTRSDQLTGERIVNESIQGGVTVQI